MSNLLFWERFKTDPQAKAAYELKLKILSAIREFFIAKGLLEVEAPILQKALIPESYLEIFHTEETRKTLEGTQVEKRYLLTSPESFQKKLLAAGFGSNFAITKSFRNAEPVSGKHLTEFSMLEWYEIGSNYEDVMKTTEELFLFVAKKIKADPTKVQFGKDTVNISAPWKRLSMRDAFLKTTHIDLEDTWNTVTKQFSKGKLAEQIQKKDLPINITEESTWEELFNQLFLIYVEPNLDRENPVILYDFPSELSPLAKARRGIKIKDALWAERFEVMIAGLELCDTYTENIDAVKQVAAFKREEQSIKEKGKMTYPSDESFIKALAAGIPECSGNALGIDRLVMFFGDLKDIDIFDFS